MTAVEWCGTCSYQRVRADGTPSPGHLAECGPDTPPPAPPARPWPYDGPAGRARLTGSLDDTDSAPLSGEDPPDPPPPRPAPPPWVEPAADPPPGSAPGWRVIGGPGHARGGGPKVRVDYIAASGSHGLAASPAIRARALTGDTGYMFKGDPPGGVTYRAGETIVTCDVFRRPGQDRWRDVPCEKHDPDIDPACLECRAERTARAWLAIPRGGPPAGGTLRAAYQPPGTVIYAMLPGVTELAGQPDQEESTDER